MSEQALILAGHGSHRNPDSATPTHAHADAVRTRGVFEEVRVAFWKEDPSFRAVLRTVDADEAVVVPVFISAGYFVNRVLPREFGLGEADVAGPDAPAVTYADPVGTHEAMTDVVAERARRTLDVPAEDAALAVVGHGTERNPNSADAVYDHVARLRDRDAFAEVGALFMDEPPYVDAVCDHFDADDVAVVPLFVADGFHTQDEIPELLGITDDPDEGYPVPGRVDGRRIWYASAVGTDPLVPDVILERAAEAGADVSESVTDPRPVAADAARAFVSWVEAGGTREWGELLVTAEADGYELRHADDRAVSQTALDARETDPATLRSLVRYDETGDYRPFAGERSLPTGWVLAGLDRTALLTAISTVYPAAIETWAATRDGDLAPVPYRETADRQTGIYESVSDLDSASLSALADAVCGDCAKRRTWDETGGAPLPDDDAGAEAPPCREACSFFVAAAREVLADEPAADHPTPDSRTTDAVPRGDLTDPANRYRVRYRRRRGVVDSDPTPEP